VKESLNSHIFKILQSDSLIIPMRMSNQSHIIAHCGPISTYVNTYTFVGEKEEKERGL